MNEKIQGKMVTLNSSCDGLETALKKIAGKLSSKVRLSKGSRGRAKVRGSSTNFLVLDGETHAVETVRQHLQVRHGHVCL